MRLWLILCRLLVGSGKWQLIRPMPTPWTYRESREMQMLLKKHIPKATREEWELRTENWSKAQLAKSLSLYSSLHSPYHLPSSSYSRKRVKCRRAAAAAVAVGLEKSARICHFGQKTFNHVGALSCCCPQVQVRGQGCRGGVGTCHIHGAATWGTACKNIAVCNCKHGCSAKQKT